jgi:RNA polymerase sigma factor (sigma-70 family)
MTTPFLPSARFAKGVAQTSARSVGSTRRIEPDARERAELLAIVLRAQAGDLNAQSELVRRYTARVSAFVRPIISQPSAVEDVAQMVFIKMARRLGPLRNPVTFESWLFKLARNTALDFIRHTRCRPATVSDEAIFANLPHTDSHRIVSEIMEALDVALTHLSRKDRIIVTMIVQGSSYRAAAEHVDLTTGAVKIRLNRVRAFLRVSVGEAIGLPPRAAQRLRPPHHYRAAA